MVLTITKIWKVFVQERDFSVDIVTSMEKAKRNKSSKTKAYKIKEVATKAKKIYAKKSYGFCIYIQ